MQNLSPDSRYLPNALKEVTLAGELEESKVNTSQCQIVSLLQTSEKLQDSALQLKIM